MFRLFKPGTLIIVCAFLTPVLKAETQKSKPLVVGSTAILLDDYRIFRIPKPANYKKDPEYFYKQYVAGKDKEIARAYSDQWRYHNIQAPYENTVRRPGEFLTPASTEFKQETDVRRELAERILRTRTDAIFTKLLGSLKPAKSVENARRTIQEATKLDIKVEEQPSSPEEVPSRIKLDYDFFSDVSSAEYIAKSFSAALRHPHLLSSLTGSRPKLDEMTFTLSGNLGENLPTPSLGIRLDNETVGTGLGKRLSQVVTANLSYQFSLRDNQSESYGLGLTFDF